MAVVASVSSAACAAAPRAFLADVALEINTPAPLSTVVTPFAVAWTTTRRDPGYAVFLDRAPMPPGHTVRDVADAQCRKVATCPDPVYLAGHGIYVTTGHSIEVLQLPIVGGTTGRAPQPAHIATVVALDAAGHRKGDVAWTVEFHG
jgi:hypothetical protein